MTIRIEAALLVLLTLLTTVEGHFRYEHVYGADVYSRSTTRSSWQGFSSRTTHQPQQYSAWFWAGDPRTLVMRRAPYLLPLIAKHLASQRVSFYRLSALFFQRVSHDQHLY